MKLRTCFGALRVLLCVPEYVFQGRNGYFDADPSPTYPSHFLLPSGYGMASTAIRGTQTVCAVVPASVGDDPTCPWIRHSCQHEIGVAIAATQNSGTHSIEQYCLASAGQCEANRLT